MVANTRESTWHRLGYVVAALAVVIVVIGVVEQFVDAFDEGFSFWDWVSAAAIGGCLFSLGALGVLKVKAQRAGPIEPVPVDEDRLRAIREREGTAAAVRELRRGDPSVPLIEAKRAVDAL